MVDKQFASVNNVSPEPWTGQDTRDRGMRCLIAPHFLALSELCDASGLELNVFEEALQASIVRVDVGRTWEGGGELSRIDGFDLEQSDDEGGQTGDASPV